MSELTLETRLMRNDAVLFSEVDDGTALMDIDSGEYFHYEIVGTRIWDLIDGERDISAICGALQEEFDVDSDTCKRDTMAFLARLLELKHVEVAR